MNVRRLARLLDEWEAELGDQLDEWSAGDPDLAERIALRMIELVEIEDAAGVTTCQTIGDLVRLLDVAATLELDLEDDEP